MKVFVAKVEEHTYSQAFDHFDHVKVFRREEDAKDWAMAECEKIMHENYDQCLSGDEELEPYQWEDFKFIANYISDDDDENFYCHYHVEEQEIVGLEGDVPAKFISMDDVENLGYIVPKDDQEMFLNRCVNSVKNNDGISDYFRVTIEYEADYSDDINVLHYDGERYAGVKLQWHGDAPEDGYYDIVQIGGEQPEEMSKEDQRIVFYCEDWDEFLMLLHGDMGIEFDIVEVEEFFNQLG